MSINHRYTIDLLKFHIHSLSCIRNTIHVPNSMCYNVKLLTNVFTKDLGDVSQTICNRVICITTYLAFFFLFGYGEATLGSIVGG